MEFKGCFVPLVTPFKNDGSLDEDGLVRIVDYLIEEEKVDGLVPCGTTGESPTLDHQEHRRVIELVVKSSGDRVPIIAGAGSNSTNEAISMTKQAENVGANATLQVCPYYNKPMQKGIIDHFEAIAKNSGLPIILYNIPGRTGTNIDPETLILLSEIENIVGVKDACCDLNQTMKVLEAIREKKKPFYVLSGEDALTFSMMCLGGHGAICAVGNVIGREMAQMIHLLLDGEFEEAREIHFRTLPLIRTLFIETNPVPVKEAMEMMGLRVGPVRLPLVPMIEENRKKLRSELKELRKIELN
jgi:4-hydroxy-tetrahydrodipicolinate synthase